MKEFQSRLHPTVDQLCIPLLVINNDEATPLDIRDDVSVYLQRLQKIVEPETETFNQAKVHAWNVLDWMIEDFAKVQTLLPTLHPTNFRLKHVMYLLAKEFEYPDMPLDVIEALELSEEMYRADYKLQDERAYQSLIESHIS